ncbi:MAG TPA: CC/Se motif family (seleno)protein [Virgibacillus sp.]|nr:CC/Se motif family (seleno)protein [Virgibacillus sp.]
MNLDFYMEDKAKDFLEKKHNILTISRLDIDRGCAGFEDLDITYTKPQHKNYETYYCKDITVYIQKGLEFKENRVEIVISGVGPFKTIAVDGLKRSV